MRKVYWVSRCVYGHENLWTAATYPRVDTMAYCPRCLCPRRVFSITKERR